MSIIPSAEESRRAFNERVVEQTKKLEIKVRNGIRDSRNATTRVSYSLYSREAVNTVVKELRSKKYSVEIQCNDGYKSDDVLIISW